MSLLHGLYADVYDRTYPNRLLITRILSYFRPHLVLMLLVVVMLLISSILNALTPILLAWGVEILLRPRNFGIARWIVGAILISGGLSWSSNFFRQWYTARVVGDVVLQVQQDAFAAIMVQDMSFFNRHPPGKIVSRLTTDMQDFAAIVSLSLNLIDRVVLIIPIAIILVYINVRLALLLLGMIPVIIGVTLGFAYLNRQITRYKQRILAIVGTNVQETIRGISVAKNFRQEQRIYNTFHQLNEQTYQVKLRWGLVLTWTYPTLGLVAHIGTVALLYFGGMNVVNKVVTVGSWYLFLRSVDFFWLPLTDITRFWSYFQVGMAASERVFALIDARPTVTQIDQQPVHQLTGRIEFKDVNFRYVNQESTLENFNLNIEIGETLALVGHTGAGKSSLGKLIARFYEFQSGQILIDGRDIRSLDLQAYRRHLGIIPQEPFLFSGTVADNIRYTSPKATEKEIWAAAKQLGGGDWLETFPHGLDTSVGEMGRRLSMGQRQLVALTRVLLQNPAVIILDEATASIDPLTEAQIQESLQLVFKNRTAIVIAHRLSTITHADRIIALRHGQIVESGSHTELMQQGKYYAEIYNTHFRYQKLDEEFCLQHQ